jgi:hypothetical protein
MKKVKNVKVPEKENAIDALVEKQALDDTAWGNESEVSPRLKPTSIRLSSRTIQRAKIFARIHRQRGYQSWLKQVIEERINNEYALYKGLQRKIEKQH